MYPSTKPYDSGRLDVGDGHAVYWEVVGSPDGLPAIWLHGGPGAPASPSSRRNFDPARYRAVIFDQRGCGRSRPLASDADADLSTNTTDHLVADMERLRSHLGIGGWVVVGGSWGVTLALVYAQRHPERVLGMVLAAVTSGRWKETQWITRDMGRVFPRQWDRFTELLPGAERGGDLAAAYARLLASPDQAVREEAARRWCEWEDTHMSLAPGYEPHLSVRELSWQMVFARLVTHYWGHGCCTRHGRRAAWSSSTTPVTSAEAWASSSPQRSTPWPTNCTPHSATQGHPIEYGRLHRGRPCGWPHVDRSVLEV